MPADNPPRKRRGLLRQTRLRKQGARVQARPAVYRRWKIVLDLIIEDDGGNRKVETKRGKLFRAPSDEAEILDEDEEEEELTEAQEIAVSEMED